MSRQALWIDWWSAFIPEFCTAHPGWLRTYTPPPRNYLHLPSGRGGVLYSITFRAKERTARPHLQASVWMDDGDRWWPVLSAHRDRIDRAFNSQVIWDSLEGRKAAHVVVSYGAADPSDRGMWPAFRTWAIEAAGDLRGVVQPVLTAAP